MPLWPSLRSLLPAGAAEQHTAGALVVGAIRPLLLRAGELTPIEKAERRVLVLANPGRGLDNLQASATIYFGMQLVLPGETAPNHRHTPQRRARRGRGRRRGARMVDGERCPMAHGDLILTPERPCGTSIVTKAQTRHLARRARPAADGLSRRLVRRRGRPRKRAPGPCAYGAGGVRPAPWPRAHGAYPLMRYDWQRTRDALDALRASCRARHAVELAYVNPETGGDCLDTLAFSALLLRPGEESLPRTSAARVFHVVEGAGDRSRERDSRSSTPTLSARRVLTVRLANGSARAPAYFVAADESPHPAQARRIRER